MIFYIGIDDTDKKIKEEKRTKRGTGRVAREAARALREAHVFMLLQ